MSYKFGMILSMVMVVAFFLLGGDMISMSAAYSALDSTSISIGYLIAKTGRVASSPERWVSFLSSSYNWGNGVTGIIAVTRGVRI